LSPLYTEIGGAAEKRLFVLSKAPISLLAPMKRQMLAEYTIRAKSCENCSMEMASQQVVGISWVMLGEALRNWGKMMEGRVRKRD
jgi:hypothetical protein